MKQREIWKRISIGLLSATLLLGNAQCVWASENPESLNTSAYSEYNISLSPSKTKGTGDELGLLGSGLTISWTPVGELTDHAELRASIDKYLGVTGEGKNKQGSLYTNIKGKNDYNNVFSVAMNNSAVKKALNTNKNFIANAACNSYTDLDIDDEEKCVNMALNAYFNLLPDGTEANADASLTRAQFMAMVMRADTPVTEIQTDTAFEKSVGQSEYNRYAQSVNKDSYLTLNNQLYNSSMTRAEAVYTIVSRYYADSLKNASSSASCYTDAKDGGAVAKSDRASALNNSISNPDSGMDRELYKSLCVAKEKNLLTSARSRWDEAITKNEAIALLRSVYTNKLVECNAKGTLLTSSSTSTNKTTTVKKATATKKQTVKIKKYKKSKKLYVKKATKAYKVTSTGKLKAAKSLKKSAKVTVVGTATVKKVKYYAIKSGKSTLLVKQSLLSKTKPKTAKPSSKPSTNSSNSNSTASHPQNNTPSGYKEPKNDTSTKTDKYGNSLPKDIKKVKIINGKVEYRDVDGTIKYAKYRAEKCNGYVYYDYWYDYKEDGMWIPIEMTDLTECTQWTLDSIYEEQHGTIY